MGLSNFFYVYGCDSLYVPKRFLRYFAKKGFDLTSVPDSEFELEVDTKSLYRVIEFLVKEYCNEAFTCIACYSEQTEQVSFESPYFTGLLFKPVDKEAFNKLDYSEFVRATLLDCDLNEFTS